MNREHPSPERLQRYFDGETPDEPAELRAHLADCPECAAQQARLGRLRALVTTTVQQDAAQLDSDRLFAAILQGIASDAVNNVASDAVNNVASAAADNPASGVLGHLTSDAARAQPQQPTAHQAVGARARTAPVHRLLRLNRAAPLVGALALAAAVMLIVYRPDGGSQDNGNEDTYEAAEGHSEVVQVDFGANAGTVFDISLSDGSSVPVVWIDDDEGDEE